MGYMEVPEYDLRWGMGLEEELERFYAILCLGFLGHIIRG